MHLIFYIKIGDLQLNNQTTLQIGENSTLQIGGCADFNGFLDVVPFSGNTP